MTDEPMKTCSRCRLSKPHRDFYFNRDRAQPGAYCKPCVKEKVVGWQKANPEKKKARDAKTVASRRARLAQDPEAAAAYQERMRAYQAAWCAANPDLAASYQRTYREKNVDVLAAKAAAWRKANPESVVESQRRYHSTDEWRAKHREAERARRKRASGIVGETYRRYLRAGGLPVPKNKRLNGGEWLRLVSAFGALCVYCGAEDPTDMDHIVPLSKGGLHVKGNVLPACRECNSSKRVRPFHVFCEEHGIPPEQQGHILTTAGCDQQGLLLFKASQVAC